MPDHARWIGRQETVTDIAAADRVAGLMALLDDVGPLPDVLPPLGHWLLARSMVRQSELGEDGHPKLGGDGLLPPIAMPRRMWAASDVTFLAPIPLGASIERRTTVAAITPKHGRSGAMLFVTLDHEITTAGVIAIRERQQLVYRDAPAGDVASRAPPPLLGTRDSDRVVTANAAALFRYSALTFNAHRIHYDHRHAASEGYPDLVVHGPLAATLLLDHACRRRPDAEVRRFTVRAHAPLFVDQPFTLAVAGDKAWITDARGPAAMTAEIGWVAG